MSGNREIHTGPILDLSGIQTPAEVEAINDGLSQGKTYRLNGDAIAEEMGDRLKIGVYIASERQEEALLAVLLSRAVGRETIAPAYAIEDALFSLRLKLHRNNPDNKAYPF